MSEQEICDIYDANPGLTLPELATITGKTIAELKNILLAGC